MDTTLTRYDEITASLPKGYRAREFRDSDREPMVAERNEQVHELQRGTADEWREWEKLDPPKDLLRVVVETPDGAPAASGDIGGDVSPWMTRHPETVDADESTQQAGVVMIHGGFRHLPVLDAGAPVGIVSIRDLMRVALEDVSPRGV